MLPDAVGQTCQRAMRLRRDHRGRDACGIQDIHLSRCPIDAGRKVRRPNRTIGW